MTKPRSNQDQIEIKARPENTRRPNQHHNRDQTKTKPGPKQYQDQCKNDQKRRARPNQDKHKTRARRKQDRTKTKISPTPKSYQTLGGHAVDAGEVDLVARMMSMGTLHKCFAVSGAVATAGAARISGTVVHDLMSSEARKKEIMRLGHPGGVLDVGAVVEEIKGNFNYKEALLGRTARRLMEGYVLIPEKYANRNSR